MSDCWNREAVLRPTASEIETRLDLFRKQPNIPTGGIIESVELKNVGQHAPGGEPNQSTNPTDEELLSVLRDYLATQDLFKVTKRSTRAAVMQMFPKADLTDRKDFLNQSIDIILMEDEHDTIQPPKEPETQSPKAELYQTQPSAKTQPRTSSVSRPSSSFTGSEIRRKLVIVGDAPCGKTSLLLVFSKGVFPERHENTIFENYVADVEVDGRFVELHLWDTSGLEDYDRLRPLSYPDTHVVLICFSISTPDLLDNITEKWILEVKHFCAGLPFILVGCKKDLRRDPATIKELRLTGHHPVTPEEGMEMATKIGALKYLECSAKTGEGVREVFQWATRAALVRHKKSKSDKCIVC
ncbi:GTP-binding protein Rho1 [Ceratobasidium sp. 428]|nr:GTP-binding protein Rho1 [Ceratobasidium sp. 428]